MTATTVRRKVTTGALEVRTSSTGVTVEGHASTFNQPYSMGWYTETVAPGAFSRTLKQNPDVRLLVNHDGLPLARTRSGTLELSQDDSGLYTRATLDPSDPDVKRLVPKMARGDLNEMSFSFGMTEDGDEWSDDFSTRTLKQLNLNGGDVSIVTYPANPNANVSLRSRMLKTPDKLRDLYSTLEKRSGMRTLLENLTTTDDSAEAALLALSTLIDTPTHNRHTSTETALRIARIRLDVLKHS